MKLLQNVSSGITERPMSINRESSPLKNDAPLGLQGGGEVEGVGSALVERKFWMIRVARTTACKSEAAK